MCCSNCLLTPGSLGPLCSLCSPAAFAKIDNKTFEVAHVEARAPELMAQLQASAARACTLAAAGHCLSAPQALLPAY